MAVKDMKSNWSPARLSLALAACLAVFGMAQVAVAQMGDVGMAVGAVGLMNNNPIAQQSQQTQRASALAAGRTAVAPVAAATPPAAAAAAAGAPAVAAAVPAAAPAPMVVPAPAEAATADLHAPFRQSLFFSPQDIIAIMKASKTPTGVAVDPETGKVATPVIPMNRFISVSGISYKAPDNWVVWINGRKVVKGGEGVLKELVDLKVQKDYVDMIWFDIGLNGTIKIKMRPNQTYYIVPGLLLPGVAQP